MSKDPPYLNAGNAGPFTLDGTRTYRVGKSRVALLDPGPDVVDHVRALASWVEGAEGVSILLTHGHRDHAAAAPRLAADLGVPIRGPEGVAMVDRPLADGEAVDTDEGALVAVGTPGHAEHHFSYHWVDRNALFVGDLFLGQGDTTWVGEYPGCVRDYLSSLHRVGALAPAVLYPAHGPPLRDVAGAVRRYERHRMERIRRVEELLRSRPESSARDVLAAVYGRDLPSAFEKAALLSLEALIEHVRAAPAS